MQLRIACCTKEDCNKGKLTTVYLLILTCLIGLLLHEHNMLRDLALYAQLRQTALIVLSIEA
jgi:hypothetical protein